MPQNLHIDFVSDVACPWCAIGLHSLEEALRRVQGEVTADIHFQPFELSPDMSPQGENLDEHIGRKYGAGPQQLAASREAVKQRAASVGFAFNSSAKSHVYNTFDAHRLLHWAGLQGRQRELKRILFRANFTDDSNVSDHEVLAALAAEAGLAADQAREVLASGRYAAEVRSAEQVWLSRGIQSVPGIVINGKWLVSGGQPPEVFEQALREIARQLAPGQGAPR
ncbi:MAG TPA: DsbA family oxidoreductase [Steroidobacteraceae bacterium]|nr:DsbA family oxidoreductase [Steroidobacteraceae bacterium]